MSKYLVQLDFISFMKFNSLAFCCANTLFSPFNAFYTFQSSGINKALLVLLLAPFAGLLLGLFFGVLAFPLYKFLTVPAANFLRRFQAASRNYRTAP